MDTKENFGEVKRNWLEVIKPIQVSMVIMVPFGLNQVVV